MKFVSKTNLSTMAQLFNYFLNVPNFKLDTSDIELYKKTNRKTTNEHLYILLK